MIKCGSLVVPLQDYGTIKNTPGIEIKGITPNPETICEVTDIYDNEGESVIKIAESKFFYFGNECGFLKKIWREVQENTPLSALLEEIEEHVCITLNKQ